MDTMPPQAPPALASTANEAATAAVQRLANAQAWLAAQDDALPVAPDGVAVGGLDAYLARLDAFWETPVATAPGQPPMPRHDALAARLAAIMTDDAELLGMDGSLDTRAVSLATAVSRAQGVALPPTVHARELLVGDVAYAGALVVTDDTIPDLALLFSPTGGWQVFSDLDDLHRSTETTMRERMTAGIAQPGVSAVDLENVLASAFVSSRDIVGRATDAMVQRVRQVQEDHAAMAWALAAPRDVAAAADGAPVFDLVGLVARTLAMAPHVDIAGMLERRGAALQEALVAEQLSHAPAEAASAWRSARADHAAALTLAKEARLGPAWLEPTPLTRFAHDRLKEKLASLGIDDDPSQVTIHVYPAPHIPSIGAALRPVSAQLAAWALQPAADTLLDTTTLLALSLRNLPAGDSRNFRATGADGRDLTDVLRPRELPGLIRDLDLGGNYRAHVARILDKSFHGKQRSALAKRVQLARMALELEDARIGDYQPGARRSFREHREDRGYGWVRAVLDVAEHGGKAMFDGHAIYVSQVMYEGAAVRDVFVIEAGVPGRPKSVPNVIVYTPDAPDGRTFREFDDQAQADRDFFYSRTFEEYLLERLPPDAGERAPNGAGRRFRVSPGSATARWVFNQTLPFGTQTESPFTVRPAGDDMLGAWHEASLAHLDASLASLARTAEEADDDAAYRIDADAIARQISGFIGRPFHAAWRAYDAVKAGDHAAAFVDFAEAYTSGLDVGSLGALVPHAIAPILVRATRLSTSVGGLATKPGRLVSTRITLPEADLIKEPRFLAKQVDIRDATAFDDGIYTIAGKPYVQSGKALYGVRRDDTFDVWRLAHPEGGMLTASAPLRRHPTGQWGVDTTFGLPGGVPPGRPTPAVSDELRERLRAALHRVARFVGVPEAQRIMETRRMVMTIATNRRLGRNPLQGLLPAELDAVEREFAVLRAGPARAGARPRTSATAMPRGNPPGVLDLTSLARRVPFNEWPNQVYMEVPTASLSASGILTAPRRIAGLDGLFVLPVAPVSRRLAAPYLIPYSWVRIDLNAIARHINDPAYAGFSLRRIRRGPEMPGSTLPLPPVSEFVISSDAQLALRILPGDFTVLP